MIVRLGIGVESIFQCNPHPGIQDSSRKAKEEKRNLHIVQLTLISTAYIPNMRLVYLSLALFAAFAIAAPTGIPDSSHALAKRSKTFLFRNGYIYANPTDPNLLRKVTRKCYVPSEDVVLLFTDATKCTGSTIEQPIDVGLFAKPCCS